MKMFGCGDNVFLSLKFFVCITLDIGQRGDDVLREG